MLYKLNLPRFIVIYFYSSYFTVNLALHKTEINLQDAVDQKLKELTTRKKTDPVCNYQVNESPDGKEFIVDFLLGESKNDRMTVVEFNAYHYKLIKIAKDTHAIINA